MSTEFPEIICIGEALTDLLQSDGDQWIARTGGACWNVARALARLGQFTGFAGAVSQDIFGNALLYASRQAGLDTRCLQMVPYAPLLAIVQKRYPPSYFFIGNDSADLHFDPRRMPHGWQHGLKWAHFGGISLARQPLADRLLAMAVQLKQRGVAISYDLNYRNIMDASYDTTLVQMCELASLIKVSDDDLRGMFRTEDVDGAFVTLRQLNPTAMILYTRGSSGATLHTEHSVWYCPTAVVKVVDTIGAGDASMAAMLYSLHRQPELDPGEHLAFAVAGGAIACTASGANAGTLAQLTDLAGNLSSRGSKMRHNQLKLPADH